MGVSLSTTARRRSTAAYYPPPPYPLDHYPPFPAHSPPTPAPELLYSYYHSNAFSACNHSNPLVGRPTFSSFHPVEWQQLPPPPRAVAPPCTEQKQAKIVRSDVNVHKESVRLEADELDPTHYLVSFVFDALVGGSITIWYFTKVESNRRLVSLLPETYIPIKIMFEKGLRQEFRQPSGTGIDLDLFAWDDLANPKSREDVFPIVISVETCPSLYDRSYLSEHVLCQMQITQAVLAKNHEGHLTAKVVRQILWTDGVSYELREIFGLGKSSPGFNDSGSGKECVICMTEPKDIAVLPCRHMCMCGECAKTLRAQSNKCPICRESIESLLEIKIDSLDQ